MGFLGECSYKSTSCIHYREGKCIKSIFAVCPAKKQQRDRKKRRKKYGM